MEGKLPNKKAARVGVCQWETLIAVIGQYMENKQYNWSLITAKINIKLPVDLPE